MAKIFISYARKDKDEVYPILDLLEQKGYDCWIDKNGIESGDEFKSIIITAINECQVFLYMLSENSVQSEWVKKEYSHAKRKGKDIIPIFLKGANDNDDIMFDWDIIDHIDTELNGWQEKILNDIQKKIKVQVVENIIEVKKSEQNNDQQTQQEINKLIVDVRECSCWVRGESAFVSGYVKEGELKEGAELIAFHTLDLDEYTLQDSHPLKLKVLEVRNQQTTGYVEFIVDKPVGEIKGYPFIYSIEDRTKAPLYMKFSYKECCESSYSSSIRAIVLQGQAKVGDIVKLGNSDIKGEILHIENSNRFFYYDEPRNKSATANITNGEVRMIIAIKASLLPWNGVFTK